MSKDFPITLEEYLMGRDKEFPLTPQMKQDAEDTVEGCNELLRHFGEYRRVTSGYRPGHFNSDAHGAPKGNHPKCRACDLEDKNKKLKQFCIDNLKLLELLGLYMESPDSTPDWVHLQIVPPKSGKRVFIP